MHHHSKTLITTWLDYWLVSLRLCLTCSFYHVSTSWKSLSVHQSVFGHEGFLWAKFILNPLSDDSLIFITPINVDDNLEKIVEVVKEVEFFRFLEVPITTDERMKTASMLDWRISSWTQLPDQLKTHDKKPVVWVPSLWVQMPAIILEKRRMQKIRNGWTYLFYCLIQLPNTWPNACALVPEKPCDRFQVVVSGKVGHSRAYYLSHWWGALMNKKKDWYQ